MKRLLPVLFLLLAANSYAEMVKKGTKALQTIDGKAMLEFNDSATVYPYEPALGKWRMIMWVGFVDTVNIQGDTLIKAGSPLYELVDFTVKSHTVVDFKLPYFDDIFANTYPDKKKFALYLYIPEEAIMDASRLEKRLENVLGTKKKNQWEAFETFKKDFGFVDAFLVGAYTLHFTFDGRSPEGANDFRMMVFTDTAKQIVAVANDGYRKVKLKAKHQEALDRTFTIYYLVKTSEEDRRLIEHTFKEVYRFRD